MKKLKGFTLIELLVVISIIAMLLAILMPSLQLVKKQAQAVVCRSNVKQFGVMSALYAADNNNKLTPGHGLTEANGGMLCWPNEYGPYHEGGEKVRLCPSASKGNPAPVANEDFPGSTFKAGAWGGAAWGNEDIFEYIDKGDWFSYGMNSYACDAEDVGGGLSPESVSVNKYWKTTNARGAYNIPLMGDCAWFLQTADDAHEVLGAQLLQPAEHEDVLFMHWGIELYAINRHMKSMNMVFVDGSARRVDLKELWTLSWHRKFDTKNVWTLAGGATKAQWEAAAPWMASFKDY